MRTYTLLAFAACLLICQPISRAQSVELGVIYGFSGYIGDLQQSPVEVGELHKAYGIFSRINFNNTFATRFSLLKGSISGADANYNTLEPRRMRNLSFRSPIYEASLQLEVNFLQFGAKDRPLAKSYLFTGVSAYYFNPQAEYNGEWHELQPLGTEGQKIPNSTIQPYQLVQMAFPIGFGFRIMPVKYVSIGFELGYRKTLTDYLDDVGSVYPDVKVLKEYNPIAASLSFRTPELGYELGENPVGQTRGASGNDSYFIGGITLSINLSK